MPRKKGTPKTGGRKSGTPNKLTAELRERIKIFLENNFDVIEHDFNGLTPERRISIFERYLKFVLPQLQNTSVDFSIDKMTDDQLTELLNRLIKR